MTPEAPPDPAPPMERRRWAWLLALGVVALFLVGLVLDVTDSDETSAETAASDRPPASSGAAGQTPSAEWIVREPWFSNSAALRRDMCDGFWNLSDSAIVAHASDELSYTQRETRECVELTLDECAADNGVWVGRTEVL